MVTYLLGAGASIGCIPIMENLTKKILNLNYEVFDDSYRKFLDEKKTKKKASINSLHREFLQGLEWLELEMQGHASIDTLARKYFLQGDEKSAIKLKALISCFIMFTEEINPPDPRYDGLFSSLINNDLELDSRVRIVSWNYDLQVEKVFSKYVNTGDLWIDRAHSYLKTFVKMNEVYPLSFEGFQFFRLNGFAALWNSKTFNWRTYKRNTNRSDPDQLAQLFHDSSGFSTKAKNRIKYAWEGSKSPFIRIGEALSNTNTLVIIGYSFPYVNREIDRLVLGKIKPKQIIINDPNPEQIRGKLYGINSEFRPKIITQNKTTKEFVIPNEL